MADDEHVSAQIEDLLGHVAVDAVDEGHDRDDRRYSDHHAQQRQDRPQLVGPEREQGDANCLGGRHWRMALDIKVTPKFTSLVCFASAFRPW